MQVSTTSKLTALMGSGSATVGQIATTFKPYEASQMFYNAYPYSTTTVYSYSKDRYQQAWAVAYVLLDKGIIKETMPLLKFLALVNDIAKEL